MGGQFQQGVCLAPGLRLGLGGAAACRCLVSVIATSVTHRDFRNIVLAASWQFAIAGERKCFVKFNGRTFEFRLRPHLAAEATIESFKFFLM